VFLNLFIDQVGNIILSLTSTEHSFDIHCNLGKKNVTAGRL
jgi:hypothetical protein